METATKMSGFFSFRRIFEISNLSGGVKIIFRKNLTEKNIGVMVQQWWFLIYILRQNSKCTQFIGLFDFHSRWPEKWARARNVSTDAVAGRAATGSIDADICERARPTLIQPLLRSESTEKPRPDHHGSKISGKPEKQAGSILLGNRGPGPACTFIAFKSGKVQAARPGTA